MPVWFFWAKQCQSILTSLDQIAGLLTGLNIFSSMLLNVLLSQIMSNNADATVRILCFSIQIWILLENRSRYKLSHLKWRWPKFEITRIPLVFCISSPIRKSTNLGPSDLESPQESALSNTYIIYLGGVGHCYAWQVWVLYFIHFIYIYM